MILYVFNNYFPDSSGFGRRCLREIEALSTIEDVVVICRRKDNELEEELYLDKKYSIKIVRYQAKSEVVHRPENYKGNGLYELKRNLDIMMSLGSTLIKLIKTHKDQKIHLYAVTSPLTVPLLALCLAKLFRVKPSLVSFHDLEPELAMHLKKIPKHHWIVKVELLLEWIVCRGYKKILVTTEGQLNRLVERTGIKKSKILAIPNSTDIRSLTNTKKLSTKLPITKDDFVLVYMSTLSFGYTIDGFIHILEELKKTVDIFRHLKIVVIGGGEGLPILKASIEKLGLQKQVICTGFLENPIQILQLADAAIIPWEKDDMTETMLPTKLFEYLSLGIPVIAPDFGEFTRLLKNKETAVLYRKVSDINKIIETLQKNRKLAVQISSKGAILYNTYTPQQLNNKFIQFIQT